MYFSSFRNLRPVPAHVCVCLRERERERIFSYYKSPETMSYDLLILGREEVRVVYKQQNHVTLSTGCHRQYFRTLGAPLT